MMEPDVYDERYDQDDAAYRYEPCDRYGNEPAECCENCGIFQCPRCSGPRVCDDLYVGWCNHCAG